MKNIFRFAALSLVLSSIAFAEECVMPAGGRTLIVPPVRYRLDVGGSHTTKTSEYFIAGPPDRDITQCTARLRLELANISGDTQTVAVYVRPDSNFTLTGVPGVGKLHVASGLEKLAGCSSPLSITIPKYASKAALLTWACSITGQTAAQCDLTLTEPGVTTSPTSITTVVYNGWETGVSPTSDLRADASCNTVSGFTIHVGSDRGAVSAAVTTLSVRQGGYVLFANGEGTLPVNGGRPF